MGRARGIVVAGMFAIPGCHASEAPAQDTSSSTSSTAESTTLAGMSSESSGTTAVIEDGPPVVIDFGKSQAYVAEGDRITLTAFVRHPRGDDAVVAGTLFGPGEPAEYGAMVRGVNGRWSIEIGWDDVDAHMDLSFERELVVEVVARFVDDAGLTGEGEVQLPHQCSPLEPTACDGECADLSVSPIHCGGCDHPCEAQRVRFGSPVGGCSAGACAPLWSDCIDPLEHVDCASACTALGSSCVENGCGSATIMVVASEAGCGPTIAADGVADPDTCDAALASPFARCCCAQD
ncbi:MAG TPA: hypothetical protein VFG69_10535 [Nannocystaceae bacterium]|nr:hypothetical protein [Nannocystaceae bacterium]